MECEIKVLWNGEVHWFWWECSTQGTRSPGQFNDPIKASDDAKEGCPER